MMPAIENCVALSGPVGPTRLVGVITHKKCQTQTLLSCTWRATDPGVQALVDLIRALGLGRKGSGNSLLVIGGPNALLRDLAAADITCHHQVC